MFLNFKECWTCTTFRYNPWKFRCNTVKFCEDFNKFTQQLPAYFFLKVIIFIFENRTFKFNVKLPSSSYFLNILKYEQVIKVKLLNRWNLKSVSCIKLNDVIQLTLFKFPNILLKKSIRIIFGCIKSMNIIIIY